MTEISSVRSNNPANSVNDFHANDDVDSGSMAHHHTLGYGASQAAPGQLVNDRLNDLNGRLTQLELRLISNLEFSAVAPGVAPLLNNSTWTTVWYPPAQALPVGTKLIHVLFHGVARAGANAAVFWRLGLDMSAFGAGTPIVGPAGHRCHNNGDQYNALGPAMNGWHELSVPLTVASNVRPYVDGNCDAGGAATGVSYANFFVSCFG